MKNQRLGSTRIITPVEPGAIAFKYTKKWSAFDRGSSEQEIFGIDAARCACAVKSFQLAHAAGLPTHFIRQVDSVTIHVQEFSIPGHKPLSGKTHGRVLPLEWIWRDRVYGSLWARIRDGKVDPVSLGFSRGVTVTLGMKLPRMLLECTTKFEKVDRHLSDDEARELAKLSDAEWKRAQQLIIRAVGESNAHYESVGFDSPDGKLELAMTRTRKIVIVDGFGTQDENRIVEKGTGRLFCKDLIRNYLSQFAWKAELDAAKKKFSDNKSHWPAYPRLPESVKALVAARYAEVADRYAGVPV